MPAKFKIVAHTARPVEIVEVWLGDKMVATIYPTETGCRVMSSHIFFVDPEIGDNPEAYRFTFTFRGPDETRH